MSSAPARVLSVVALYAPSHSTACEMLEALPHPGTFSRECLNYPCPPSYPQAAIRERLEGEVVLSVRVSADGTVLEATVLNASGHRVLDEAAIRNVSARRFPVYTPLGASMAACFTVKVPIAFRFDGSGDEG